MPDPDSKSYHIAMDSLPSKFPTHKHEATFWESLGRAVATFGFLEEILGRAIFAFTATRPYPETEVQQAFEEWLPKLEHALTDQLWNLIKTYEKAVREHPNASIDNFEDLLDDLRKASTMRNILCHGSWQLPDPSGASLPRFVNRQIMMVDSPMDHLFLDQVQQHVAQLACAVMNTFTQMGWRFPGSTGPGTPIWPR